MARQNEFGSNWWAKRWISVLESFGWDTRLQRGRTYARAGNVKQIEVAKGEIAARVKGSRPQPYRVTIKLQPISQDDWEKVLRIMAGQAVYAAKLLSGQMPQVVEEVFKEARVALFPASSRDLVTDCSCPDWANPCKHIAAVYYLLGSEFDCDPFLLFWLRGRTREETIAALRDYRGAGTPKEQAEVAAAEPTPATQDVTPLDADLPRFWRPGEDFASVSVIVSPPRVPEAVLKRLGPPPLGPGSEAVLKSLAEIY